jgi:ParB/RepB/Spo0J family partition protein
MNERNQEAPQTEARPSSSDDSVVQNSSDDRIIEVDPLVLRPNPYRARVVDGPDPSLGELEESIRKTGLIEPPIVRQTQNGYEIATGHRRVQCCIKLALKTIRCILRSLTDEQMAETGLEQDLRHKTLNPCEEAKGYAIFRDEFHWSEERIAQRFQVTRDIVAQRLRLLTFPEAMQRLVAQGQLTVSHAEAIAIAPAEKQLELAQTVVDKKLTVKKTTEIANGYMNLRNDNQEALETIGPRLQEIDAKLTALHQDVAKHESLLAWFEFHTHPWKAQDCVHNVNGFCRRFNWPSAPSHWIAKLQGITKFEKLEDGNWHVQACGSVCAHCHTHESPKAVVFQQPTAGTLQKA